MDNRFYRIIYRCMALMIATGVTMMAEGADIKGIVLDEAGAGVDYASVRVLNAADSTFVRGSVAGVDGRYVVTGLADGRYVVTASCIGYAMASGECVVAGSTATLDFRLERMASQLGEIVVKSGRFIRTTEGLTVHPGREQIRHSYNGYDLIRNLMIPGVNVDPTRGEVSALGGTVTLYVDGMPADIREVRQLRPADVERIQYMDAPSGKYAADHVALNFILRKRDSGGYVAVDALQRAGYMNGDYNVAAKMYGGNTQYTVFAGTDYSDVKGGYTYKNDEIRFPESTLQRDYKTDESRIRKDTQYAQIRVRNKNERRTLRATFNFVRDMCPEESDVSALQYTGLESGPLSVATVRSSASRNFKYSLGLSGSFNLPNGRFLETSASATASRNHYGYNYMENSSSVVSSTVEDYYSCNTSITYGLKFKRGNMLTFMVSEHYNSSSALYAGSGDGSRQRLWSSETICFGQYMHPLGQRASLRLSPGMSALSYRLDGMDRVSLVSPRMQVVLAVQPAGNQFVQLQAVYGNSYPQLSLMTAATRQVDLVQQRRGNPDIKQSRMSRIMAVYGIGVGKVQIQAMGSYNGVTRLPVATYFFDDDMLVQSYLTNGHWHQVDASLSATWTPTSKFNVQVTGGYLYNSYSHAADLSAACWKCTAQAAYFINAFSVNVRMETPQTIVGYDLAKVRMLWKYGMSLSWTHKAWHAEVGINNLFSRRPVLTQLINAAVYSSYSTEYSPADRRSAFLKVAWSVDFGKKTKHDTRNIDKTIGSSILKAR